MLFFVAYGCANHPDHKLAQKVYWETVSQMLTTGEPGFSINVGKDMAEILRNACTEVSSEDDSDIFATWVLINMARINSLAEMERVQSKLAPSSCSLGPSTATSRTKRYPSYVPRTADSV